MMVVGAFIFILFLNVFNINCHNIVGCGGFVKSDIKDFPFQKLSANLVFPDGTVNYITDILPNGAFSIPVYDFGEYFLKIVGPKGWTIEPSNGFHLIVDGQDSCNDDYNFKFSGFSVYGKVSTANINQGPSGIRIDLLKDDNLIASTLTVEGGDFVINNVLPGKYEINFQSKTAEGKSIQLTDKKFNIEITNDNVIIEDSFTIHGYPVFGDVHFDNETMRNVQFYIFSKSIDAKNFNFTKYKCLKFDREDLRWEGYNPLCKSVTNDKGVFVFPLLPGGEYLLLPIYEFNNSKFNIEPSFYEFQITSHSVDLRNHFKISGFSVKGRIIVPGTDIGLSNSEIYINEKLVGTSDLNGDFIISSVNKGPHKLSVISDGYMFNKTSVIFDLKNPNIGNFYPDKIRICGSIVIDTNHVPTNALSELSQPRKIILTEERSGDIVDSVLTTPKTSNEGDDNREQKNNNYISQFCFYAVPGSYIIKPAIESTISLSLAPNHIKVQLKSKPITVKFSQFRGTISGYVKCIERCNTGEFEVTLRSTEENNESSHLIQHILISENEPSQGTFKFQDIVPGNYHIELISANGHFASYRNRWCWSQTLLPVTMIDENISTGLVFEQTGFSLMLQLSHDMTVDYFHIDDGSAIKSGTKLLKRGLDKICLPRPGQFELRLGTCHRLANSTIVVDTSSGDLDREISVTVVQYRVQIVLALASGVQSSVVDQLSLENDVKGLITFNLNSNPVIKSINWTEGRGVLDFWVEPETSIQVSALSRKYLVRPDKMNFQLPQGTMDCVTTIGKFELEPGTFIIGSVTPAIKDVVVDVRRVQEETVVEEAVLSSVTDDQGQFSLGPLTSTYKYDIALTKPGYKFIRTDHTTDNEFHFRSLKLAELHVEIVDNVTGTAISGILLSIIGNDLRRNELTDDSGRFVFLGLTAGTYYLRAMMKELEFNPSGAIEIVMDEGRLHHVHIAATRTAFSVYGKVVSLNGEPEGGLTVEAEPVRDNNVSKNSSCPTSLVRNEHGVSDDTGLFRIRGLVPKCQYRLSLKIVNNGEDSAIVRSYPRFIVVDMVDEDVHNVKLYGLRSLNLREISAMVWTNNDAYLSSLQISLFPSDNPDNVVSVYKFVPDNVYMQISLPHVQKTTEYVIRLQSSLSPRLFYNISAQERTFIVEPGTKTFYKHFEFDFYPAKNAIGDSEVTLSISSSVLLPLLLAIVALLVYKKDSLNPVLGHALLAIVRRVGQSFRHQVSFLTGTGATASASSSGASNANSSANVNVLDAADISELNSVIAKPKPVIVPVTVKKQPFWLRPKKT